ncbi:MAG TPA: nucleotidyltransferase family protein [Anaerolineae bacterium]|nr:nucleotidyltransferase family protein [Anaerolineae bacterium]
MPSSNTHQSSLLAERLPNLLPSSAETLFLRACLDTSAQGQAAWREWTRQHTLARALETPNTPYKRLAPLLAFTILQNSPSLDAANANWLRAARFHEHLRSEKYRLILERALAVLNENGIHALVLKGAGLAETVYPDWDLRHSHDIDLLLHPQDLARAFTLLQERGYRETTLSNGALTRSRYLTHSSGLPLLLHTRILPFAANIPEQVWTRRLRFTIGNQAAYTLAPDDALVQVLGQAFSSPSRLQLLWACDAYFLITRTQLDWQRVADLAVHMRCALPLYLFLNYLHSELGAPIPAQTLYQLQDAAAHITRSEQELALDVLRRNGYGGIRDLWNHADNWQARALLVHWTLPKISRKLRKKFS